MSSSHDNYIHACIITHSHPVCETYSWPAAEISKQNFPYTQRFSVEMLNFSSCLRSPLLRIIMHTCTCVHVIDVLRTRVALVWPASPYFRPRLSVGHLYRYSLWILEHNEQKCLSSSQACSFANWWTSMCRYIDATA